MLERVKLQEFMDRKGLTQQQLADKIGVNRGAIGKWNTHVSDVTRENCAKLLLAGMTLEEMVKVLRLPRSTINFRLKKANTVLKTELEDRYDEDE